MKLLNKRAVITGGASGIGLATAIALASEGVIVTIVDRNQEAMQKIQMNLSANTQKIIMHEMDIRDEEAIDRTTNNILNQGTVDILVNSAGIAATVPFLDTESSMLDAMYSINWRGTFLFSQRIARHMVKHRIAGSIIHISSVSGSRGNAGRAAYGSTKAAVSMLTEIMAVELAPLGIRVNAVAPGPIETPLVAAAHSQTVRDEWLQQLPIRRYGAPEEIARAVIFLASSDASYINGHILNVDGGFMASGILKC